MGETFRKIAEWVKQHKLLAIALSGGILLLIYLYYSSKSAAQANAASAAQAASGGPSDAILSQEIQAQAVLQQTQIAAQAQTAHDKYAAQISLETLQAQEYANNAQVQAALTLGLAQAGDSTSSILQLLGAQPKTVPTTSTVGNSTTNPSAGAQLTGASPFPNNVNIYHATNPNAQIPAAGTGTNAMVNPSPVYTLHPPATPMAAAAALDPTQPQNSAAPGTMDYYALLSQVGLQDCSPTDIACVANNSNKQAQVEDYWASHQSEGVPAGTVITVPSLTPAQVIGPGGFYDPTYQAGNVLPAGDYSVNALANKTAGRSVISPTTVPSASGSHFYNAAGADVVAADGSTVAGGLINSIHNASPVERSSILASYGIQNAAGAQMAMSNMFGANEPMTVTGVS